MAQDVNRVPKRILVSLLESLSAGVVPRLGAPFVAIGRDEEVKILLECLDNVSDGGAFMKFIVGKYGSGKSFLIQLTRGYAIEKGFVCCDADLSPEKRLFGTKGNGLSTYKELIHNLCTKTSPDGNALPSILMKWISLCQSNVASKGFVVGTGEFETEVGKEIFTVTREAQNEVGGFDFSYVINTYYKAHISGDDDKKSCALKWLCGEYTTKTDAKRDLGVGSVINDENWYDYIKLIAFFVRKIGYKGLVVFLDECVNLYKITNRQARESNYEKLLSIFNDTLQGGAKGLGVILGGTPAFIEDTRRGLFSYDALKSRLSGGRFASEEYKDLKGPLIKLDRLSDNELYALVTRVKNLYEMNNTWDSGLSDDDLLSFLKICLEKAGADIMITPREIIRDLISVLNVLYQNPDADFQKVINKNKKQDTANENKEKCIVDLESIEL